MYPQSTNRLLETLSTSLYAQLMDATEPVSLPIRTMLYEQGVRPRYAYFLTDGIASVVMNFAGGQLAEVGILGNEGVTGAVHLLGELPFPTESFVQVAGSARRMLFTELETLFRSSQPLRDRLLEFVQLATISSTQLAACNALHPLDQRLARWLLVLQDRMMDESFQLTHEFLAEMLVVQRPTLSLAAALLQREGVITYRHGRLRVLDRHKLESCACECYSVSRDLLQRLYSSFDRDIPARAAVPGLRAS